MSVYGLLLLLYMLSYGQGEESNVVKRVPYGFPVYKVLHTFTGGTDGGGPIAPPILARDGFLYGTVTGGGMGFLGALYRVKEGFFELVVSFSGDTGYEPFSGLVEDKNGILHGTTRFGGKHGHGTLYTLNPQTKKLKVIHHFAGGGSVSRSVWLARHYTGANAIA